MRLHTGEKPYLCEEPGCGRSFVTLGHLNDHVNYHRTDVLFECKLCDKKFYNKNIYKAHLKRVTHLRKCE